MSLKEVSVGSDGDISFDELIAPVSAIEYSDQVEKRRVELIENVVSAIDRHFPVDMTFREPVVTFSEISTDRPDCVYSSFNDFPEATLQLLAGVTGVPIKTVQREADVSGIYNISNIDGLVHTHKDVRAASDYYVDYLPDSLPLSAVLQSVQYRWTVEYRRVFRQDFEQDVLNILERNGIPVVQGDSFDGRPDVCVPNIDGDPVVVGEVRKMARNKLYTRFSEFESEISSLSTKHPDASIVIVFDCFGDVDYEVYEPYVEKLYRKTPESVNFEGVYHFDEIDELVADLKSVCPVVQRTLGDVS